MADSKNIFKQPADNTGDTVRITKEKRYTRIPTPEKRAYKKQKMPFENMKVLNISTVLVKASKGVFNKK